MIRPGLVAYSEWTLSALDGHGLDATEMFDLNVLLYSHVQGVGVHLEREAQAAARTGRSEEMWPATQEPALEAVAESGEFAVFTRVLDSFEKSGYDLRLDVLFELGLNALLDGIGRLIEERLSGSGPAGRATARPG